MTYAGAHGRDDVGPVDWFLHREWVLARDTHALSVRRAEATKIASKELEAHSSQLRLALGVAAGALLVVGTAVASSFSGTSEVANSASPVPEHTFAAEQRPVETEPSAVAPVPVPQPQEATPAATEPQQEATPAATEPRADAAAMPDPAANGDENQRTAPSTNPPAPAPEPDQSQQWSPENQWSPGGQWSSGGQWGADTHWGQPGYEWGSGSQWGHGDWGSGTQQWSPVNGFGAPTRSSYAAATATPTGPAMSTLDPFCTMMGR